MVVSPPLSPGVLVLVPSGDGDNRLVPVLPPLVSVSVGGVLQPSALGS